MMTTTKQLTQWCVDNFHPAAVSHFKPFAGVSTLTELIVGGVAVAIAFALGWYIKGRGMSGVQIDLNNIKNDVENLKAKIFPAPAPVVVAAPVA